MMAQSNVSLVYIYILPIFKYERFNYFSRENGTTRKLSHAEQVAKLQVWTIQNN